MIVDGFLYAFGAISEDLKTHYECQEWAVTLVISLACGFYLLSGNRLLHSSSSLVHVTFECSRIDIDIVREVGLWCRGHHRQYYCIVGSRSVHRFTEYLHHVASLRHDRWYRYGPSLFAQHSHAGILF